MKLDWSPNARNELNYANELLEILRRFFAETTRVQQVGFPEWLDLFATQAAQRMVTGQFVATERTWRAAARQSMRGPELYAALAVELQGTPLGRRLDRIIEANAALIRSLPAKVSEEVTRKVARLAQQGVRAETIAAGLGATVARLSKWHVRLIARTETGKATTALTRVRAESLSLPWYAWETSRDRRVRLSHRKMQGVLVNWNDPPSPEILVGEKSEGHYAPGDIYNCRCYPAPLLRLDQVNWPHRVYYGGRVISMTLSTFRRIANLETAIAA